MFGEHHLCGRDQEAVGAVSAQAALNIIYIMRSDVFGVGRFVASAWQWLGLWLGSRLPDRSPDKDELAA